MDLIEIHIVGAEPAQAVIDFLHDCLSGQAFGIWPFTQRRIDLRCQHDLVAPGEVLQRSPDDFLARTVRVDVGGIEEVDAELDRLLNKRPDRKSVGWGKSVSERVY